MKRIHLAFAAALVIMLLALYGARAAGDGAVAWRSVDGGGGASSGGAYTLRGSAGQPDAAAMSGGRFVLVGGYWAGAADGGTIYLPVTVR